MQSNMMYIRQRRVTVITRTEFHSYNHALKERISVLMLQVAKHDSITVETET